MSKKSGLGRGLDALFSENSQDSFGSIKVRLSDIEPNKGQPRKYFEPDALNELAESIKQHGVLQPLTVRPLENGGYQLVAGERRWRAARLAGLQEVPVIARELTDEQAMEIALVENLQREDLNPIEEAEGYRELMNKLDLTQEQAAEKVGKSRPAVANSLRLLTLPDNIRDYVQKGEITAGAARALLSISSPEILETAIEAARKGATVRDIEAIAKGAKAGKKVKIPAEKQRPAFYDEVELSLSELLGRQVKVNDNRGKGRLEIEFFDSDDLSDLAKAFENQY